MKETKAPCGICEVSDLHYINICLSCKITDPEICNRCNDFTTTGQCAQCIMTGEKAPTCKYIKKKVIRKRGYIKGSFSLHVKQAGHALQKGVERGIKLHG